MGNAQSSLSLSSSSCSMCNDDSMKKKKEVVVMKEDGEAIKVKAGTRVCDILADHPFHKVTRCCSTSFSSSTSDRAVLSGDFALNCNSLYFLLPRGLSMCDATYRSLIKSAISKGYIVLPKASLSSSTGGNHHHRHHHYSNNNPHNSNTATTLISGSTSTTNYHSSDDDDDFVPNKLSSWRPGLNTIPEVNSSSSSLNAADD